LAGEDWVNGVRLCDQYWRGWLAGVLDIFYALKDELPAIPGTLWPNPNIPPVDDPGVRDVDPDDIPF
jgi:hypothetical protein